VQLEILSSGSGLFSEIQGRCVQVVDPLHSVRVNCEAWVLQVQVSRDAACSFGWLLVAGLF
jgi:hypothetical protein